MTQSDMLLAEQIDRDLQQAMRDRDEVTEECVAQRQDCA